MNRAQMKERQANARVERYNAKIQSIVNEIKERVLTDLQSTDFESIHYIIRDREFATQKAVLEKVKELFIGCVELYRREDGLAEIRVDWR